MRRSLGFATAVLASSALASSAATPHSSPSLGKAIDAIVDAPRFAAAAWGIEVRDLDTGAVVYARNPQKDLKPASTLKLVATAAALDALTPTAELTTTLQAAAPVEAGRVLGDVYLVGAGDPDLAGRWSAGRKSPALADPGPAWAAFADALARAGIHRIEGRLIGHEGLFQGERRGEDWTWEDLVWSYGAEVSALSYNDNCADLLVTPGEHLGDPVRVERQPITSFYSVTSTATTGATGTLSTLTLSRQAGANRIQLSGVMPLGSAPAELTVALEDPARYAAALLAEFLEARGIAIGGGISTSAAPLPEAARVLASHRSQPLGELVKAVNKRSQNLHAEMLMRLLGAKSGGDGSSKAGLAGVQDFLQQKHLRADDWALQDGCGLSRSDLVSPRGLVDLLLVMDRHPHARAFRESLPIAGRDGTLEHRLRGAEAEGRVLAKTGSMRHVNALAGYATTRSGRRLAFAIILNHYTGESRDAVAAIDAICNQLVNAGSAPRQAGPAVR